MVYGYVYNTYILRQKQEREGVIDVCASGKKSEDSGYVDGWW